MKKIILVSAVAILSGCVEQNMPGIGITSASPVSVTVWGKSQTSFFAGPARVSDQDMIELAESHCQQYGKHARKASQRYVLNSGDGENWREFTFDCIQG